MADIPAGQPQPMVPIHGLVPASSTAPSASGLVPSHADPSTTRAQDVAIMDMEDDPAVLTTEARSNTMTMTERTIVIHPGNPGGPSMSPSKDELKHEVTTLRTNLSQAFQEGQLLLQREQDLKKTAEAFHHEQKDAWQRAARE